MGYRPPESFDEDFFKDNKKFTKFGTPVINQEDTFAIGMTMASFQLDKTSFVNLKDLYIKISERLDNNTSKNDEEKKFTDKFKQGIEEPKQDFAGKDIEINKMLNKIIRKLLLFDPFERYPVQIAMYILYQLYLFSVSPNEVAHAVLKEGITNEELIKILKIDISNENKDAPSQKIGQQGKWGLNSEPYQKTLKDIEELFKIRKGEKGLIKGSRII